MIFYNVQKIAQLLSRPPRTIQKYCRELGFKKHGESYLSPYIITSKEFLAIKNLLKEKQTRERKNKNV